LCKKLGKCGEEKGSGMKFMFEGFFDAVLKRIPKYKGEE
jgi:hypothetical protein